MTGGTGSQIEPRVAAGRDALAAVLEPARLRVLRVTVVICLLIAAGNFVSAIFGFTTSRQVTGPAIPLGAAWCGLWFAAALFPKATAQVFRRWRATTVLLAGATTVTAGLTGGVESPLLATAIYAGWIAVVIPPRPVMVMSAAISLALLIGYVLAAESLSEIVAENRRYDAAVNAALPLITGLVGVLIAYVTNAIFSGLRAHVDGVRSGRPAATPGLTALLAGGRVVEDGKPEKPLTALELPAVTPRHRRRMVPGTPLTETERDIVRLLADGQTPKQIAHLRGVQLGTVRSQLKRAKNKTGAKTLAELARHGTREPGQRHAGREQERFVRDVRASGL